MGCPAIRFTMSQTVDMDVAVTQRGIIRRTDRFVSPGSPYGGSFTIDGQMRDSRLEVFCDYDYVVYTGLKSGIVIQTRCTRPSNMQIFLTAEGSFHITVDFKNTCGVGFEGAVAKWFFATAPVLKVKNSGENTEIRVFSR